MWFGLRAITDYKGRSSSDVQPAASLPDELNTFYARFEVSRQVMEGFFGTGTMVACLKQVGTAD